MLRSQKFIMPKDGMLISIIRGLKVPAGKHTITFKYEPATYALGTMLSATFGSLIYVLLAITIFFGIKNEFFNQKKEV